MYINGNLKQEDTMIGAGKVHTNPATGKPQTFKPKPCRFCGDTFLPQAPSHLYCSEDCASNAFTEKYLMKEYKITLDEWICMFEKAGGRCAICGSRGFKLNSKSTLKLVVDHDHATGEVRGMLCHNCNRALGLLKDDTKVLSSAIKYLETSTTIPNGSTSE